MNLVSRLNAPLYLGPLVMNRRLVLVIVSVLTGLALERLVFHRAKPDDTRPAAGGRTLTAFVLGLSVWRLFPAVRELPRVLADPALLFVLPGGRQAVLAGAAAVLLSSAVMIISARVKHGREAGRAAAAELVRSALVIAAVSVPLAIAAAFLPVPAFPGEDAAVRRAFGR